MPDLNYDAYAGRMTGTSTRSERTERACAYAEGACQHVLCPYDPGPNRNTWHRGLYDGFVRGEMCYAGGDRAAYRRGFEAGKAQAARDA